MFDIPYIVLRKSKQHQYLVVHNFFAWHKPFFRHAFDTATKNRFHQAGKISSNAFFALDKPLSAYKKSKNFFCRWWINFYKKIFAVKNNILLKRLICTAVCAKSGESAPFYPQALCRTEKFFFSGRGLRFPGRGRNFRRKKVVMRAEIHYIVFSFKF